MIICRMIRHLFFLISGSVILCICLILPALVQGQDTLRINLTEFIERGMERSGQVAYEEGAVSLAENRARAARGQRILPSVELNTQHGIVPGVISRNPNLSEGQYYLDPNLENDWENWAVFTRGEISAVQPIMTWGAVNNAIRAAEAGASAAEFQFNAVEAEASLQLYELYYSYLLAKEIAAILADADTQLARIKEQIEEMREEEDSGLKESDIFKFEIFETEFAVQKVEVEQSVAHIRRVWDYVLKNGEREGVVYEPAENFLDPVPFELEDYEYYRRLAMDQRPELRGVDSGIEAADYGLKAVKAQQLPSLFLGLSASYANTPNRPRQTNPFIRNNSNYASLNFGIGIRQNLDFRSIRTSVEKARIEQKRVYDLKNAVSDGIILELNDRYREAVIAEERVRQSDEALTVARNWVRHEQLNYDYGFGDVEDLTDAIRQELELRLELKQNTFDLNKRVAELYKEAGISLDHLSLN